MALNGALLLLLVRAFSAAMLMLVSKMYLAVYLAGGMALYLLQKVVRGDFHYWIPIDGAFGLFTSLVMRVVVKTVTDFTGLIQFRNYPDLGGFYWTVNMFLALLASFASVFVCYADDGGEGGLVEFEERAAWTLVGGLSGVWVVVLSSKCAGTHTRHQSSAGACSEGYEYGASRPAAGGVRERMDIWGCQPVISLTLEFTL